MGTDPFLTAFDIGQMVQIGVHVFRVHTITTSQLVLKRVGRVHHTPEPEQTDNDPNDNVKPEVVKDEE